MTTKTNQEPIRVESVGFRTSRPQLWFDHWRNRDRIMRFRGVCVTCGRRTYGFDDGENDPRGVLGDHAASPMVAEDYDSTGPDVVQCFPCANEEPAYRRALTIAHLRWSPR